MDERSYLEKRTGIIDNDEIFDFVNKKVESLKDDNEQKIIGLETGLNTYHGFINSDIEIRPIAMFRGFAMNDNQIYCDFLDYANNKDPKNEPNLVKLVYLFIENYFGRPTQSSDKQRTAIYSNATELDQIVSISEFKDKNIAACIEKSAVAQNLLTLLGINSEYVGCDVCLGGQTNASHAVTIFDTINHKKVLFDPAIPVVVCKDNMKYVVPALFPLSQDEYIKITNNGKCDVNFSIVKDMIPDGYDISEESNRTYCGSKSSYIEYKKLNDIYKNLLN